MRRLYRVLPLLAALAWPQLAAPALAQNYPSKPVRVITTSSAGGISDIFIRIVGEELSRAMGQRFFVENKPGAGSNTAAASVAKGDADGYTLFLGSVANVINSSVKARPIATPMAA